MNIREEIAVYLWAIVSAFTHTFQGKKYKDWDELPREGKELVYPIADQILSRLKSLIEEMENPYPLLEEEYMGITNSVHRAYEKCRQFILSKLQ